MPSRITTLLTLTSLTLGAAVGSNSTSAQGNLTNPIGGSDVPIEQVQATGSAPTEYIEFSNEPGFQYNENNAEFIKVVLNTLIEYIRNQKNERWQFNNPFPDKELDEAYQKHELTLVLNPGYQVNIVLTETSTSEWLLESFVPINTRFIEGGNYSNSELVSLIRNTNLQISLSTNQTTRIKLSDFMESNLEPVISLPDSMTRYSIPVKSVTSCYRYMDNTGLGIKNSTNVYDIWVYIPGKGYNFADISKDDWRIEVPWDTELSEEEAIAIFTPIRDSILSQFLK